MLTFERVSTWHPLVLAQIREHYTGSRGAPPGKKMAWIVTQDGSPIAVLGLGEPAYKLAPRRRLGLEDARPAPHTVSNWIFRRFDFDLPPERRVHGSEILELWHDIAARDWEEQYGWRPIHWETMVLPTAVQSPTPGAAYRRAGYRSLGWTTGRSARRPAGSTHGARVWGDAEPKLVLYRGPLARR